MQVRQIAHAAALALALAAPGAASPTAVVASDRDNTLYEDGTGGLSNGAGQYMFAGQAAGRRRALVRFDVAGNVPPGATILAAVLTLHCSRTPPGAPAVTLGAHRVLADWGEGASDAGWPGGAGAASMPGDATWVHTFHNGSFWTTPGGDFALAPSAMQTLTDSSVVYSWGSTPPMAADVQAWLDAPASNFGWILLGGEDDIVVNAKRLDTREHPLPARRPALRIEYQLPGVAVAAGTWTRIKSLYRD